jgi:hypothetical protein
MQINGDEYSTGLCLATIPMPFNVVTKLVPLTVAPYCVTFLALEVKAKVPFPKPLLGLGFDGVVRCKSLASECYF